MSQYHTSWKLSRGRFADSVSGLSATQLNYRLHPGTLSIGEMALHVAGVEIYFHHQLTGEPVSEFEARVMAGATDGVVNDKPFPFAEAEITPDAVASALRRGVELAEPMLQNPSPEILQKELVSALGPVITGDGALARWAFHPAYHHGQVHLLVTAPDFPR